VRRSYGRLGMTASEQTADPMVRSGYCTGRDSSGPAETVSARTNSAAVSCMHLRALHITGVVAQVDLNPAASWVEVERRSPATSSVPPGVDAQPRHSGQMEGPNAPKSKSASGPVRGSRNTTARRWPRHRIGQSRPHRPLGPRSTVVNRCLAISLTTGSGSIP
jgi:hypothetical protein